MSNPNDKTDPDFTTYLLPSGSDDLASNGDDSLLPLVQHWVLTLMVKRDKTYRLPDCGKLRGLFKVGKSEYWRARSEEHIEYADDVERGYDADMRRKLRRTAELLAEAYANVEGRSSDYAHPLFANLRTMADLLGLNATELSILCILVLMKGYKNFYDCLSNLSISVSKEVDFVVLLSEMTSSTATALHLALRPDGALRRMGLLSLSTEQRDLEDYFEIPDGLSSVLMQPHESAEPLVRHFFTPRAAGGLGTEHFPHLQDEISIVAGIVRQAMRQGIPGTNILLYGPPGVGKTEFALAVAGLLGADIFEVGYADSKGNPIRGIKRLQSYNLCQRLLGRRRDAMVLFDEVEDMLEQGETPGKAWVNRALEENSIPAIWITNDVHALDPAYRRRFDYSLHMRTPPRSVRLKIAQHHLSDIAGTSDADPFWLEELAAWPELTPAQLQRAAKVASLVETQSLALGSGEAAQKLVIQALERSSRLLGHRRLRSVRAMATSYDIAYLNTDAPIAQILESLRMSPSASMCFHGPPGVGKTELARHIAQALDLPIVQWRGSDLLSMYVGGTEENISEMFLAASSEPSVLILDEADSFLQARSGADHSWEITQVNELLTQMEEHNGLFICTTNFLSKLDAASLRRFDWKIGFRPMTASQRWAFFLQEFHRLGGDIAAAQPLQSQVRQQLHGMTPGDFAPVTRRFRLLARTPSAPEFLDGLRGEQRVKNGGELESDLSRNNFVGSNRHTDLPLEV